MFAATNEAFDAMNNEELQQMEDKSTAASILLKHIVVFDDVEIPYGQTAVNIKCILNIFDLFMFKVESKKLCISILLR